MFLASAGLTALSSVAFLALFGDPVAWPRRAQLVAGGRAETAPKG
jgi:hypothetical protein